MPGLFNPMTLLEKHGKCLADLINERQACTDITWGYRLDQKIIAMQDAIRTLVQDRGYE